MPENTPITLLTQRRPARATALDSLGPSPAGGAIRHLYIHVPFCFHKCHYCDFYSLVDTRDRQPSFVSRLETELASLAPLAAGAPLRTIFVGGGTPSLLAVDLWQRLLQTLARLFDLSEIQRGSGEFTVECNPETVTPQLMDVLVRGGVSRVSLGAQSFDRKHLKTLERWHEPANVGRALEVARASGIGRQSIDLIFAVPGQSIEDWTTDLDQAIALGTEHLSCYSLTYEPNTAMTARLRRGEFARAPEDLEIDMQLCALERLRSAGFERYEISNFARPGAECRHNLAYWRQREWLAAGPSASAHVGGHRWKNVPRLDDYLNPTADGSSEVVDHEGPDEPRALVELIMTGLRTAEGLDAVEFISRAERVRPGSSARLTAQAERQTVLGSMRPDGARWQLTDDGLMIADAIAVEFMRSLDGPEADHPRGANR